MKTVSGTQEVWSCRTRLHTIKEGDMTLL